jgi:ABC-2 type transport system permease protein
MNYSIIRRLIVKDWYLQRWLILSCVFGGFVALGIVCLGGQAAFMAGLILLITALVAIGAQLAIANIVNERKEQTLSFVMTLPISYVEYTLSKLLGTVLIFLIPWMLLVLGSFALFAIPHGVPRGLFPLAAIMATQILANTCLAITVALVTENQGWTVAAIMVGNIGINLIGYFVAHLPGIARGLEGAAVMWSPTASVALATEFAAIALMLCVTFFLQSRKRDFI